METITIDGSFGEGGGQILRTSLTLGCVTHKRLRISKIRAARRRPGLAKQHLSCVAAACEVTGGECKGAEPGSQTLDFEPGRIRGGDYHFDIGSAGSASLVMQTILPVLFLAEEPSSVTVTGGTHNPWAPPYDFLAESFLPAIAKAGFTADCRLLRHGFFPAGGGKMRFEIQPWRKQQGERIELYLREGELEIDARVYTAKLPPHVAERQRKLLLGSRQGIGDVEHIEVTDSLGPGNCAMVRIRSAEHTTILTAFGARGKPSLKVISEVVNQAMAFLPSTAAVDRFLADQLLIYMAMQKGGGFSTNELSKHLATNIEVIKKFMPVEFVVEQQAGAYRVLCEGK